MSRQTPAGLLFLGAGLGFGLGLLRKTLLRGLHVLHFGEHDVGGVLELKRNVFQLRGALRKTGLLVFHILGLMNASKFDRPRFCPTAYRWQRRPAAAGSEAGNPMRTKQTPRSLVCEIRRRGQGCLDAAAGSAMLKVPWRRECGGVREMRKRLRRRARFGADRRKPLAKGH